MLERLAWSNAAQCGELIFGVVIVNVPTPRLRLFVWLRRGFSHCGTPLVGIKSGQIYSPLALLVSKISRRSFGNTYGCGTERGLKCHGIRFKSFSTTRDGIWGMECGLSRVSGSKAIVLLPTRRRPGRPQRGYVTKQLKSLRAGLVVPRAQRSNSRTDILRCGASTKMSRAYSI